MRSLPAPLADPLAFVGRYGTQGFALSIFVGLALPQFAAAARPLLGATIFAFLTITFARVDLAALAALVRRPARIGLSTAWLVAAPPLVERLALLVGGALAAGAALRASLGTERIRRHKARFDGLGVLFYALFAVAAMDGVLAAMLARPGFVAGVLALVFGLSAVGFAASLVALRMLPPAERFVLGYASGQRNIGVLVAALGAATPGDTFLFFALAQFPIYLMPQIVKPVAGRLAARQGSRDDSVAPAPPS